MKKIFLIILAFGLMAGITTMVWASVIGTPHDLAPEPCAMCHTPHSAAANYPLWNRVQTSVTYTLYNSISFDMANGVLAADLRAPSSLCMVCHNGVASELANYPGPCSDPDGAYDLMISGCADLSNVMTNDHPVSFNYIDSLDADNDGFPATVAWGSSPNRQAVGGTIANYPLYGDPAASEYNWFECTTCHAVHNTATYPGQGDYQVYFLRADNTGSGMCLDCHKNR